MQKKLIALAIAGLSSAAFAQSNVTISGQIKGGYTNYKTSGLATGNGNINSITDQTSSFVLRGTEALGNGLSAIFQIDNRFQFDQRSGTLADGNTHVGLKGSFGEFKMGAQDLHYNEQERIDAGAKTLSQQYSVTRNLLNGVRTSNAVADNTTLGVGNTRSRNTVFWDSPNWSGFTARAAYSTGAAITDSSVAANREEAKLYNLVGRYENGPLKAGVSYLNSKADAAAGAFQAQDTGTKAWVGYTLAGVSFGLAYDQSKRETSATAFSKRDAWAIPVSYKMGNHGIYASYGKAGKTKTQAGEIANSGAKQIGIGYDYEFSKRTSVGVNYTKISNDAAAAYTFQHNGPAAVAAGGDYSQLYAGVRHAF